MTKGDMSGIIMFKNQLQEYVQKASLPKPSYKTTQEGPAHQPKFTSTVIVNGISYVSPPSDFRNRKAAEHAAARVALEELGFVPNPLHEMGRYKNLLQEYTQKRSLPLPNYRCEGSGKLHSPTYVCTVEVSGIEYTGGAANTKKEAQTNAARVALQALESQAVDSVSQGTVPNIFPSQGVGSVVLTSPVEVPPRKRDREVQSVSEENETAKTKQKMTASNSMQVENGQGMPTVGDPQSAPVKESEKHGQGMPNVGDPQSAPVKESEKHSQKESSQMQQDRLNVEGEVALQAGEEEKHSQKESSQMQQDRVNVEGEVALQAGEEGSEKLQHHEECNPLLRLT